MLGTNAVNRIAYYIINHLYKIPEENAKNDEEMSSMVFYATCKIL